MMENMFNEEVNRVAKEHFYHQYQNNSIYKTFVDNVNFDHKREFNLSNIPYLPISAFKYHKVISGNWKETVIYTSSGTGGDQSRHFVRSNEAYLANCKKGFEQFYGPVQDFAFYALLPGYLEREGSSLISMMNHFIQSSKYKDSGFFLNDYESLISHLKKAKNENRKAILWGVTYALLDFGELYDLDWSDLIVLETGGMKGKRKEMIKRDLHHILKRQFGVRTIHSEYGMTELLSQAYSLGEGIFTPCDTMHVHCRSIDDPFAISKLGKTGQIHIFDQANWDSISFIATEDLGRMHDERRFEIIGRKDHSEQRGCNLLLEEFGV